MVLQFWQDRCGCHHHCLPQGRWLRTIHPNMPQSEIPCMRLRRLCFLASVEVRLQPRTEATLLSRAGWAFGAISRGSIVLYNSLRYGFGCFFFIIPV